MENVFYFRLRDFVFQGQAKSIDNIPTELVDIVDIVLEKDDNGSWDLITHKNRFVDQAEQRRQRRENLDVSLSNVRMFERSEYSSDSEGSQGQGSGVSPAGIQGQRSDGD